ncbi:flagellar assembly protein FliH [Rhodanobacter sp. AS-Z3]|uniref:flagellar assembly protein FliH n=1 Tax=Rhodanobacter sp. AS-Z3 TaxID=3031330 RepID=UPI00247AEF2F|nr:flagellar assembly protein FliH [Rhodanobacter sp. AS-Z3]WEN14609.1 flagellar assembly protein FliH [Rhodanobacter sp. AS-Z3]
MTNMFNAADQDFQRWELPEVGSRAAMAAAPSGPAQPTVRDLEALEQQARDEGYAAGMAEGLAEGRAAAQQQLRQRMAELEALYDAAARPLQLLDDQAADELAGLAGVIARRVVMHELKTSPELIANVVRQSARALPMATRELRIHVNPQDLALLQELGTAEPHWQLLGDHSLVRGDCRLESERSRLDARVETRLAAVIDALLGDEAAADEGDA